MNRCPREVIVEYGIGQAISSEKVELRTTWPQLNWQNDWKNKF